jgi:predicted dehydrogenase
VSIAKNVRIGIVGAGFAAGFHVDNFENIAGVDIQLSAVTSLRPDSRKNQAV